MAGCCEQGNEFSGFIKFFEFLRLHEDLITSQRTSLLRCSLVPFIVSI
jgi:hypothetical protein